MFGSKHRFDVSERFRLPLRIMSMSAPTRNTASKAVFPCPLSSALSCALFLQERSWSPTAESATFSPRPGTREETFTSCPVFCLDWSGSGPLSLKPGQAFRHLHNQVSNYRGPWKHTPSCLGGAVWFQVKISYCVSHRLNSTNSGHTHYSCRGWTLSHNPVKSQLKGVL